MFWSTRMSCGELCGGHICITGGTGFFGCWLLESFAWANDCLSRILFYPQADLVCVPANNINLVQPLLTYPRNALETVGQLNQPNRLAGNLLANMAGYLDNNHLPARADELVGPLNF